MTELDEIVETFGVSEPVFKIVATAYGELEFKVKNEYTPPVGDEPVSTLLATYYRESLDKYNRCFEKAVNVEGAYSNITSTIRQFALNASPLKNPKQSKLYKWLCSRDITHKNPSAPGFIMLYRYIITHNIGTTGPHAKNVIAILELMREKYEDKSSSN